jgi:mono/diheme cytochrome c family protein
MRKSITLPVLFFMALAAVFFNACTSTNDTAESVQADKINEDSLQQVVARGEYLSLHVAACIDCHSHRDFTKYSGPVIPGTEGGGGQKFDHSIFIGIPGTIYSMNITPDSATGIGTWSDAEIIRAITQGINKKGDTLFPLMPYANFNRMTKSDLLSIVAYLRTLKPINNKVPERQLMIPISMAYPGPALQKSIDGNVMPSESDSVKYGGYLFTMAGCSDCHTPFAKGQPDFSRAFAGGNEFTLPTFKVNSANITPDSATGIGSWTETAFLGKFLPYRDEKGYNFAPGKMNTIMPVVEFAGMTDGDLKSIYAYLRTVKPVKNKVVKYPE